MNPVLTRLNVQRDEQIAFIDQTLARVEEEARDLTDSEQRNLEATRERIKELDKQIAPLAEFDELREASAAGAASAFSTGAPRQTSQLRSISEPDFEYRTAGEFLADYNRAHGIGTPGGASDPQAVARIERAAAKQTTSDTPGLLPEPIRGPVYDTSDANRPFVAHQGAIAMDDGGGSNVVRLKISQHVTVDEQSAELEEVNSTAMKVVKVEFEKKTLAGAALVSIQDIKWTSPKAMDLLSKDYAKIYAKRTEKYATGIFAAGVTQKVERADDTLTAYLKALYAAAGKVVAETDLLPNCIYSALDQWETLGALLDEKALNVQQKGGGSETSGLASFAGRLLEIPRVVVPSLPAGTLVVGHSEGFEFHEQQFGVLSALKPVNLGVEVAYGGFVAAGFMDAKAFCKVAPKAGSGAPVGK